MIASTSYVHVAVGIVQDTQGRILITRRADGVHQGGLWEFPGGKLETGEDPQAALIRELHEELGIEVLTANSLLKVYHEYPDKRVLLDVWRVECYRGQPQSAEDQPLDWLLPQQLSERAFPAADKPIITALRKKKA
ncbi:MAG: 8-oxo-dGTP diphosphatase MutT [Candidatus Competibacteraceae bacterium]|jgi:8-oxo-dGTP diphosphatase|nr:8-oxo-dGTP diphosphatase MutT [Candidatus Competibacteraceae bacterium]